MSGEAQPKIAASHLKRNAYLYVRQSSCGKSWSIPRARNVSMPCASEPWLWAGRRSRSS